MDEATILTPDQFNERFTIYLNADGKPVQRTLREMTADEVMQAEQWNADESQRLHDEVEHTRAAISAIRAKGTRLTADDIAAIQAAKQLNERASDAIERVQRLMALIEAQIPQWERHPNMTMRVALRRWWPGGRAV